MNSNKQKQSGIINVGLIVAIIIAAAAITYSVWHVWQSNQKEQKTGAYHEAGEASGHPEGGGYLSIDEWGVQIALPDNLRGDVYYVIDNKAHKDFGGPIKIDFISSEFSTGSIDCGSEHKDLISIYREIDGQGGETIDPTPFKRLDNTRFYFSRTSCEEAVEKDGTQKDKQIFLDLKNAIQNTLEISNR